MNSFKKSCKTTKPPPLSVVDSLPKTQRSGREKTKCNTPFQTPTIQPGLVGSGGKWESSPFYRGNPNFSASPHGRQPYGHRPARTLYRIHAGPWPRDTCPRASARSRARGDLCPRLVGAGSDPRPRGPAPARTHLRFRADARVRMDALLRLLGHTSTSGGKCGHARTSVLIFSSKNVLYDIPAHMSISTYLNISSPKFTKTALKF
jgi:hypothetical protein